jgi:hypothetical protein
MFLGGPVFRGWRCADPRLHSLTPSGSGVCDHRRVARRNVCHCSVSGGLVPVAGARGSDVGAWIGPHPNPLPGGEGRSLGDRFPGVASRRAGTDPRLLSATPAGSGVCDHGLNDA